VSRPIRTMTALAAVGFILVIALDGCSDQKVYYAPLATIPSQYAPAQSPVHAYRIGPGDELEVKFFFAPELNDRMTVRPDGKISLMFAQDLLASGKTADELASDIRAVLAPHVKQLDLVVIVRSFASQRAFVGGEVAKPGPVTLAGNETVLQVLSTAGWITPLGAEKIVVVRRDKAGQERIYPIDLADLENGKSMEQNIVVQPYDMILVPPSDIVVADRWVDQNIKSLLPFTMGAGLSYNINSSPTQH
jgi:protein involved in polysaccharide export with SLBB domain